jgi:hypothetical protein
MSSEMYGILGTLLGVFVGAPVTYFFAKKMFNHQRLVEASAQFREAFLDELILCKKKVVENNSIEIIYTLNQQVSKHNKAILRFRPFVSKKDLKAFDNDCLLFSDYENRSNTIFADISGMSQETDLQGLNEKQIRGKVRLKIERIFKYAPTE